MNYTEQLKSQATKHTMAGLPNNCAICGQPVDRKVGWWAADDNQAQCGQGICKGCFNEPPSETKADQTPKSTPKKTKTSRRAPKTNDGQPDQ